MTIIDLKNIIIWGVAKITKKSSLELSYPLFQRNALKGKQEKIARQHTIQQMLWESELNELRLEIESIRSNVRRTSCVEDRKKTSSNHRISIRRAKEHVRETSPAVSMAEATIPVTTSIKEEKVIGDFLRVVHVKVKGEQGILNAAIDTGAQIPVVTADVFEGQSVDNKETIQITSAFSEHEIGELKGSNMELNDFRHGVVPVSKNLVMICSSDYEGLIENSQMVHNPAILREPSKEEGIINSVNSKSVCSQEVVTDLLLSFPLHRPGMTDELFKREGVGVVRSINTCYRGWLVPPWNVECEVSPCGQAGQGTEIPFPLGGVGKEFILPLERNSSKIWRNNFNDLPMRPRRKAVAEFRLATERNCLLKHLHRIHVTLAACSVIFGRTPFAAASTKEFLFVRSLWASWDLLGS
ncbi:hypothetical protein TNCV_2033981 [Trichonephila clavipes]|nr:hypothetical protein TNCV_2033981 [Trichonephila clavipes]